jgi:hypothetical protein
MSDERIPLVDQKGPRISKSEAQRRQSLADPDYKGEDY